LNSTTAEARKMIHWLAL